MGPKKKPGEEGEDLSIEQFFKNYKKNCTALGIPVCKIVREKYETDYLEEGNPISKVLFSSLKCSSTYGSNWAGRESEHLWMLSDRSSTDTQGASDCGKLVVRMKELGQSVSTWRRPTQSSFWNCLTTTSPLLAANS
jgi:hypothetical protein